MLKKRTKACTIKSLLLTVDMNRESLLLLQSITAPFADFGEHVQGPGGNTSVKQEENILIKASGFTFKDVAEGRGVVILKNEDITANLLSKYKHADTIIENAPPQILDGIPSAVKPSMEFEFHALLGKYVLHTHSVYANIITCSVECEGLLAQLFGKDEYILIPYVTPGFPIAAAIVKAREKRNIPSIIFLKNHGIIVYGNNAQEVIEQYRNVQKKIIDYFKLPALVQINFERKDENTFVITKDELRESGIALQTIEAALVEEILIPDQSVFFKNKVSAKEESAAIMIDAQNEQIIIRGTSNFITAAKEMLQAVCYIKQNIAAAGLTPDYIPSKKADILHELSTEKYRLGLLKSK